MTPEIAQRVKKLQAIKQKPRKWVITDWPDLREYGGFLNEKESFHNWYKWTR